MPSSEYYREVYKGIASGRHAPRYYPPQKGNGFFGRLVRGSIMPMIKSVLPYLKNVALEGVGGLVEDLKEGKTVKEAAAGTLKRTSSNFLEDMSKRVRRQSGSSLRHRRRKGKRKGKRTVRRATRPQNRGVFKV